jgi:hypothetical protein
MTDFVSKHRPPGAALAVSRNGRLVYARGFGYADVERKDPVQPTSCWSASPTPSTTSRIPGSWTEASIRTMPARPPGAPGMENGKPAESYYACGWQVRPVAERQGRYIKWHLGLLSGSSTLLVARHDGINWAALFNCDADRADKEFAAIIDPLLHQPADRIKNWPDDDLYKKYSL